MECNKDEAARAKEISEKKFLSKDIAGAKKFAAKAHYLYPDLEGISSMLATLDVYVSAENKICGQADWYGILGVNPQADDDTIRKQYRKLALTLHPDKNKSIGAEGAFKLISQAWSLLSDKVKRLSYDQQRNPKVFQQNVKPSTGSNGFFNFTESTTSNTRVPTDNATKPSASSAPGTSQKRKPPTAPNTASSHKGKPANVSFSSHKEKSTSFWTVCHQCKMQYEYLRMYLNHKLLCPNCHEPFLAVESTPPASKGSKVSAEWNFSAQQNSNHQRMSKNMSGLGRKNSAGPNTGSRGFNTPDSSSHTSNFQWGLFTKSAVATTAARAADMVKQTYNKVKREREEAQAATKRKSRALGRTGYVSSNGNSNALKRPRGMVDFGGGMGMGTGLRSISLSGFIQSNFEQGKLNGTGKLNEIRYLLMEKARTEIRKKLKEWSSATPVLKSLVNGEENVTEEATGREKDNTLVNGVAIDQNKFNDPVNARNGVAAEKSIPSSSNGDSVMEPIQPISIDVPDSEFHNFDRDRTESCFGENQVWAAYDDDDGMPRYYAMIHNVISSDPFKIRIGWLNSKANDNCVNSGFLKTCGDFDVGKHEISSSLNSFSHMVRWSKGTFGAVQIYPRKGDVWALYRNWSAEWNEFTEDEVIHKYDIVEVVEDYDEEGGVTVIPLVKVAGFKTVFHHHLDPKETKRIPREEIFRFSHHIPSYLLTGQEAPNAPKGCWELDPAATPFEFLQVITYVNETETVENEETIVDLIGDVNNQGMEESSSKVVVETL
ncbi:hypothetical protein LguiA_000066 [Lonicera macranthoides]